MSLAPKIDEIHFRRETWLSDSIQDTIIQIPGYNIARKDRLIGGVCLYIKENISYEVLNDCHDPSLEVLWVKLKPNRLPRGFSSLVVATVYHPPSANPSIMIEYLLDKLSFIESSLHNCGIILLGDFNRLDVSRVKRQFRLKQMVNFSTRGSRTLDLFLTNLSNYYMAPEKLAPYGLSDHFTVLFKPKSRGSVSKGKQVRNVRDLRPSSRAAMSSFVSEIDWSILDYTIHVKANYLHLNPLSILGWIFCCPLRL
jgi:hypothetical protein